MCERARTAPFPTDAELFERGLSYEYNSDMNSLCKALRALLNRKDPIEMIEFDSHGGSASPSFIMGLINMYTYIYFTIRLWANQLIRTAESTRVVNKVKATY